jgi:zinc transporter ZupT
VNSLAASIASPSLSATAQVVGSGVFGSLSGFVGGLVGGWAYQALGPRQLFHNLGLLLVSTGLCFFLIERAITPPPRSESTRAK